MPAVATAAGLPTRLGKYELLLPLATGGMARIYIGRSTGIGSFERHVVLKLITAERANDESAVQMFLDEARLAASLNHQNVAQVFEVGEDAGIHYLAMEYVHGQDLRAVLAKAGSQGTRIPLELALTIVAGAAAGLNHAHERRGPDGSPLGIVHRDVSPSNLMIGYDGSVKLLDFGIAKATSRSIETQSGIIKGKFAYMAPEQCRGRDVDRRSDVFSLGIILYEVTTQHRCFRADSDFDTMHRIVTGDVVRPTRLVQNYPQALEAVVMKALAVDPVQRYQSAGMLLEAIEGLSVASRMNLSTMGLGRFMRDLFGEVVEPWLNRTSPPVIQKENTISSTNRSGASAAPESASDRSTGAPPTQDGDEDDDERFPDSGGIQAANTILDLQRGPAREPEPQAAAWEYPPPTTGPELVRPSYPMVPAMPVQPSGGTFSGSSPSLSALTVPGIPSTRHGYASGNDLSYPRYEPPPSALPRLQPNRRPLVIGLVLSAIVILLAVLIELHGGSASEPPPAEGSDVARAAELAAPEQGSGKPEESDDMIHVKIDTTPEGADVLVAGTRIGTTPLDTTLKRGTKSAPLTVQLAGYDVVTSKIDMGGDVSRTIPLKPIAIGSAADATAPAPPTPAPPAPTPPASTPPAPTPPAPTPPAPTPPVEHKQVAPAPEHKQPPVVDHRPVRPPPEHKQPLAAAPPEHKTPPAEPVKPRCQSPGAFNPWDTSCNGSACPPCK